MEFGRIRNYINGEWAASTSDEVLINHNPATGAPISEVPMSTAKEVDAAVRAAHAAFEEWRRVPAVTRARYLMRFRELLEAHYEELSVIQTKEHGKTIDESRGETRRGIENVEVACGIPTLMMGESLEDVAGGIDCRVMREPLGVFACIAPFNFPFMIPLWFMPYALATGNTFVVKASEYVPNTQTRVFEIIDELDLPPGVVNLVHGGRQTAEALIDHSDVRGITFVGSSPVAKQIYRRCGAMGKRVIAQGGAKNCLVVMPDAELDPTIAANLTSFFGSTGQRCLAGANALVVGQDGRFNRRYLETLADAAAEIKLGDGLDETTQMGPLQAHFRKERVMTYIDKGIAEGADLLLDGRQHALSTATAGSCFLGPSIFDNVRLDMSIAQDEIFGPVATVIRAGSLESAIDMVNSLPYGNMASIFTSSGKAARTFAHGVQAGNVGVNIGVAAPMAFFPFSGMKNSFYGVLHGQGKDVVRFFTESKVLIERWF
ncbi:MAG: CoA-acylating methylmalonate-semialdehyde dehydrogenase [Desulfobacteraceae bacterium]|nr:MAG: CoA-acylating methylmalonate-semialdehyde dehydrogenase [Desulfobacteraceae bacterium]